MDEGSTTIALTTRLRKRSISAHRQTDNNGRTSLIKTKIQKIDGQYKASPTCPINNEQEQENSSDDQDEPLIVATVPPLVQNSSKYRTRQDIYDDETGDDQQSNSSSPDYSPTHEPKALLAVQSPMKSTIVSIQKPIQLSNDHENETSLDISTTRRAANLLSEESVQEKSIIVEETIPQRTKITKKSNVNKSSVSSSLSAISIEQNQINNSTNQISSPLLTFDETRATAEDTINKPLPIVDVILSNNKQSQNPTDQSNVKVRLKPIVPSPQTKKNNKLVSNIKTNKTIEQKPTKIPTTIQKETVITPKKVTPTVTPKKLVKTTINKPLLNNTNSEKQPARPPSIISSSSKPIEKKSSDNSNSIVTKKPTEPPSVVKPAPVKVGKIPKLNSANKQKATKSVNLTDQRPDLLATDVSLNKELNTSENNLANRQRSSPYRLNRPQQNNVDNSEPSVPLSPMDLDDNILGKQSSTYPSLLDNNPRLTSNFSHSNSIGPENTQSQSPLSPGPSSTLYPPPSPPTVPLPLPNRSIPPSTTGFIDSRNLLPLHNEHSQSITRKPFSTPPVVSIPRPNSLANLSQSIAPQSLISNDYQEAWTTQKPANIWDAASSDEELDDDSNARRFFQQNMRAVDEELYKVDELDTTTPPLPSDSRTEQLLKRQKKASLCLSASGGPYEGNNIEPSASVDDFECVAMDLDSPKHRTQSESSDNNQTIVESNNSKINGTADPKIAELTTASSIDTSKKLTSKNRPLKTTSMTLIDELKNSMNPSSSSKQSGLSPPDRSLSRSRSRSRSRTRSRSHSRSRSQSSSSSHKRRSRSRHRSSKRRSNKHYQRHRSNSYDDKNELSSSNNNNYPPAPMHHHHHHHPPPLWPQARQVSALLPGPPPPPPPPYGHQAPVPPPLLPHHSYYPPANRPLIYHQEPAANIGGRFNFQHNHQQRHHPPLMHPNFYPPGPPQPLMQSTASRAPHHHPMNRYPPPVRPFDMPPLPMPMGNVGGPHQSNPNYNQYKYESEERLAMRREKHDTTTTGPHTNHNRRGGVQQVGSNGKKKMNNPPKSNANPSDHQEIDQLFLEREKLLAQLNEISTSGDNDKRSISSNHFNPTNSQDDEGEEGEISESD